MPSYRYRALDTTGTLVDGHMEASSLQAVVDRLRETDQFLVDASEDRAPGLPQSRGPSVRGVRDRDITAFTRELATLLAASQPLDQALETLIAAGGKAGLSALMTDIAGQVRDGAAFSVALGRHPGAFPPAYVSLIRAGEATGTVHAVLERLAEMRERSDRLRDTALSAVLYPAILVIASVLAVLLLLGFVVPQFERIFAEAGAALPMTTRIVIAAGTWIKAHGLVLILGVAAGGLILARLLRMPGPRRLWDETLLGLPLAGPLLQAVLTARFCRTLGTLIGNGVDLQTALTLTRDALENKAAVATVDRLAAGVRDGGGIAEGLAGARFMPLLAMRLIRVGEETGQLHTVLLHLSAVYETKLETGLKRMTTILEPVLIIGVGLVIGFIIYAILTAVINLNELAF